MSANVLVADDHAVVRQGVRSLLESCEGYAMVGEASDGRQAVELARKCKPDIVLMDPAMPGLNGADATVRIRTDCGEIPVLALSMHSDAHYVCLMLSAGASGYVLKTCDVGELLHAMKVLLDGGTYLTPEVASQVVDGYLNGGGPQEFEATDLSSREREVLQMLAEGKTAKQIGRLLHVSSRTVDSHRQRIMAKLKVDSVASLTKCAIRMGLTAIDG